MDGTDSGMISAASVAFWTSETVTPGASSFRRSPLSVGSMTAISVTIRLTRRAEVSGREQCWTIFGLPLTVCVIATMTRLAALGARHQIHRAAHARHHPAGHHPVGQPTLLID